MTALLANDTFMTWALLGSVYFMSCAMCWRATGPNKPPHKRSAKHWNFGTLCLAPFAYLAFLPSMLTVAALRTALKHGRGR